MLPSRSPLLHVWLRAGPAPLTVSPWFPSRLVDPARERGREFTLKTRCEKHSVQVDARLTGGQNPHHHKRGRFYELSYSFTTRFPANDSLLLQHGVFCQINGIILSPSDDIWLTIMV